MKRFFSAFLAAAALCALLSGCAPRAERREQVYYDLFDTVTSIVGYAAREEDFRTQAQAAYNLLARYHKLYDIYNSYEGIHNLKTVNDNAGVAPVVVDREIIDLLLEARELYGLTGRKVNVALGPVLSLWHDCREAALTDPAAADLPAMDDLRAAAEHTGLDRLVIDEAASTVYLSDPAASLDVGAIAKGYATERAALALEEQGCTSLLLSVGGNVRAIGVKPDGQPWRVGVQDPAGSAQDYLWTVPLNGSSLVTSGSYQRYYTVDGVDYCHIIDPDTLMPAAFCTSVTVWAADSSLADGLSTALFCLPYEEGLALAESLEGVEALWVLTDGTVRSTSGFPGRAA